MRVPPSWVDWCFSWEWIRPHWTMRLLTGQAVITQGHPPPWPFLHAANSLPVSLSRCDAFRTCSDYLGHWRHAGLLLTQIWVKLNLFIKYPVSDISLKQLKNRPRQCGSLTNHRSAIPPNMNSFPIIKLKWLRLKILLDALCANYELGAG